MKTKEQIQEAFQKAQQKWLNMCEMLGREYIDFQSRVVELNDEMKIIMEEEKRKEEKKK
jgi:hypothetical protein